jgi:hypothetical protein
VAALDASRDDCSDLISASVERPNLDFKSGTRGCKSSSHWY